MTALRLYWRLFRLSVKTVVSVGMYDVPDTERAMVAQQVEDVHRDLGHEFYDWRTHGGDWVHFIHKGDDE